jgi:carboxypeptidase Taq
VAVTTDPKTSTWEFFDRRQKELIDLASAMGLLSWDQQTYMPPRGASLRAHQQSSLATIYHERLTDERFGEILAELAEDDELGQIEVASVREARRERDRAVRVPTELVREISLASSEGFDTWQRARPENDFATFKPYLERIVALKQEEADALGYEEERYDALLDDYEPDMRVSRLEPLLSGLRDELVPFAHAVFAAPRPDDSFLALDFPEDRQWDFTMVLLRDLGFDLEAGRQDRSAHPFTGGTGPYDVRLTTRFIPGDPRSAIMASIHEAGHGMYEQGIGTARALVRTFAGQTASLGLHESQSRLWENQVGRSLPFWQHYYPEFKRRFPESLSGVDVDHFYRVVNLVEPSLIRVEADEVTYNLHILLRFELELALVRGDLAVADLPGAWNDAIRRYLGIEVPSDREGVLQDVHWSGGSIGYFPTYTLGNLYAAQLQEAALAAIPDLDEQIGRGEFGPLLEWLRENIHRKAHLEPAEDVARAATGRGLEYDTLMTYLRRKYGALYDVS